MRTTSFNADNTHGASGINAFVTPPTASTSFISQVAVAPIESSISRNKAGDRAPASLWIQRLKSRDNEPETLIRETLASNTGTCQGLHIEKSDPVTSACAFGTFSTKARVNKTTTENKTTPEEDEEKAAQNRKKGALNETRQRLSSSEEQYQGGERQQNTCEQGRGGIMPLPLPSNRGFGHQIGQNVGAKLERNTSTKSTRVDMKVNPRYASEPSIIPQTYTQPVERKCEVSLAVKAQAEGSVLVSSLGKPPLPPAHSKFVCPPKPTGHKSLGFPARSTTRIASSPANGKVTAMPIRYPSHIEVVTDVSAGPLLKEGCQAKEDGLDCRNPLSKEDTIPEDSRICPPRRIGKSFSCSEGVSSSWMYKPPKKIARQDLEAVDVAALETGSSNKLETMKLSHKIGGIRGPSVQPGGESSIAAEKRTNGVLKSGSMQKPPSEVSGQAEEAMKATPRTSTTASFPWEMFAGAAGPSRSAREDFVEVYNRARDELKNQKASSLVTKVSDKEMENCPGRATSFQNTSSVIRDGQTSERQVQQEILEKLKKVTGSASQPKGVNTMVTDVDVSLDEQFSESRHYMNFLEGEAGINPKQNSQAFQNIQVTSGKDSISLVRGRQGGPLHGYVELLPAVAPKDCNLTLEKGSECKQDSASSMAPERCEQLASTGREVSRPKFVEEAVKDIKDIRSEAPMLLSKRQREVFDSSSFVVGGGRESVQRERLPSRSEFWLQRWYPPPSIKVLHEHKLLEADRTRQDLAGCSTGNVREDEHRDTHGACDKQKLIEKGILFQRIAPESEPNEHSKKSSEKVLPSAAAMAIVGTAAREFCTVQPQRKGSFAFWSGFRVPVSRKPEHSIEKGKRKLPFEADSLARP